jgi:hypothetical protein
MAAAVESLEAALSDMRKFVVFLSACPRVTPAAIQLVPVHAELHVLGGRWKRKKKSSASCCILGK